MGRTHDHWCPECQCHFSPFDFDECPGCGHEGIYDLNHNYPREYYLRLNEIQAKKLYEVMSKARDDARFYKAFWSDEEEHFFLALNEIMRSIKIENSDNN